MGVSQTVADVFGVRRVRMKPDPRTGQLVPDPDPGAAARAAVVDGETFWFQVPAGPAGGAELDRAADVLLAELCRARWGRGWLDGAARDGRRHWHAARRPAGEAGPPGPLPLDWAAPVESYFPDVCDHCGYSGRCFAVGGGWYCGACLDAANGVTVCAKCRRPGHTAGMPVMGDEWYHRACYAERFGADRLPRRKWG